MNGVSWRNIFNLNSIFLNAYHGHENYEKTPSIIAKNTIDLKIFLEQLFFKNFFFS